MIPWSNTLHFTPDEKISAEHMFRDVHATLQRLRQMSSDITKYSDEIVLHYLHEISLPGDTI